MSAIVTGSGLGLSSSSLAGLGQRGILGSSAFGKDGSQISVNAATGNLVIQRRDELVIGSGAGINLARTYNSQGLLDGDNNDNWRFSLVQSVVLTGTAGLAGSSVKRVAADGAEFIYTWNAAKAAYVANEGAAEEDRITYSGAGATLQWKWLDGASQTSQTYNSLGQLTQVADKSGNLSNYFYNAAGLLSQIQNLNNSATPGSSQNETITLVYDTTAGKTSNVLSVETRTDNGLGTASVLTTRVRYTYDTSNRLETVTTERVGNEQFAVDTFVTLYSYDGASKRVASITQMAGSAYADVLSGVATLSSISFAGRLDFTYYAGEAGGAIGQLKTITEPSDAGALTTTLTYAAGSTTIKDPMGYVTVLTYDAAKRLTQISAPDLRTNSFAYISATDDHLASFTDAAGHVTSYQYDALGNRVLERDAAGNTVTYVYNSASQLVTATRYTVAGVLLPSGAQTSRNIYDTSNRLIYSLDAEGRVTKYERNTLGQVTGQVSYSKDVYNLALLLGGSAPTQAQLDSWKTQLDTWVVGKAVGQRVDTAYNWRGQIKSVTTYGATDAATGLGVASTAVVVDYTYDPAGQLVQTIDHRGTLASGINLVSTNNYDGLGRITLSSNPLGQAVTKTYYADGVVVIAERSVLNATTGTYDSLGVFDYTFFDPSGLPTSHIELTSLGVGLQRDIISYAYDANSRLVKTTTNNTSIWNDTSTTLNLYDTTGRLVGSVDGEGYLTEYQYTKTNQLAKTIRYANATDATARTNAIADISLATLALLRPKTLDFANDQTSYKVYDSADRLITSVDAEGDVTEYQYDGAGQLVATTARATPLTTAQLTALALKNLGTVELTAADVVATAAPLNDRTSRIFYDATGRVVGSLDALGYLSENKYDAAGRLIETVRYNQVVTLPATPAASWTVATLRPSPNNAQDQHSYFLYDAAGRQTGVVNAEGYLTESQYDGSGNATATIRYKDKLTGVGITTLATALSGATGAAGVLVESVRPRAADPALGDQITRRYYDDGGRLYIEIPSNGTYAFYYYDLAGNLSQTSRGSTTDGTQRRESNTQYDGFGRVTAELNGVGSAALAGVLAGTVGVGMTYLDQASKNTAVANVWATYATKYAYDMRGQKTSSTDALGNRTLYYYDNNGRLTHTVNALGEVTFNSYDAFGRVSSTTHVLTRIAKATLDTLSGGSSSAIVGAVTPLLNTTLDASTGYKYDRANRLLQQTDALGLRTSNSYNAFGQVTGNSRELKTGQWVHATMTYDQRGQVTQTAQDDKLLDAAGAITATVGLNRVTNAIYDAFGRVTQTTDGNRNIHSMAYDRLGRQITLFDGLNDLLSNKQSTTYDAFNRVLTQTDRTGTQVSQTVYLDGAREVWRSDANGIWSQSLLNMAGELVSVTQDATRTAAQSTALGLAATAYTGLNRTTTYSYNKDGQLVDTQSMVGTAGALATVDHNEYNSAGQLVWEADGVGHKVQYTYDALNRVLTRSVDPAGLNLTSTTVYRANSRELWSQDANGVWTRSVFDKLGQLCSVTVDPTTTLVAGGQVFEVAHAGLDITTSTTYDADGHTLSVTDPNQVITQYVYDNLGRRVKETADFGSGINAATGVAYLNLVTQYGYDLNNNVTVKTDALLNVTHYAYDSENRLIYAVDALNNVVKSDYDKEGRVTKTTAYATPIVPSTLGWSVANIAAQLALNPADAVSIALYNKDGRQSISINGEGYASELFYNAAGQVIKTVRYATQLLAAQLSNLGNLVSSDATALASQWKLPTSAVGSALGGDRINYLKYDAAGRQVASIDAEGYVSKTVYDLAGQVTETIAYAANSGNASAATGWEPAVNDAQDSHTYYLYDAAGRKTGTVDAEGYLTETVYDKAGRATMTLGYSTALPGATASTRPTAFMGATGAAGVTVDSLRRPADLTSFTHVSLRVFDAAGRLSRQTSGVTDATHALSTTLPSAKGDISGVVFATGSDSTTEYGYDRAGHLLRTTQGKGSSQERTQTNEYDSLGRVTRSMGGVGSAKLASLVLAGTATAAAVATVWSQYGINYRYDVRGLKTSQTDALGYKTTYYYNADAQLTYVVDALGQVTQNTYDALGRLTVQRKLLTSLANFSAYNGGAESILTSLTGAAALVRNDVTDAITRTTYDRVGNATQVTDANLYVNRLDYNAFGQTVASSHQVEANRWVHSRTVYDRRGLVTSTTADDLALDSLGATATAAPATPLLNKLTTAIYDAFGRVTQTMDGNTNLHSMAYDRLGRQVALFDGANAASSNKQSTTYDAFGRVYSRTDRTGATTTYRYDDTLRSMTVTSPEGVVSTTVMTAFGETYSVTDGLGRSTTYSYNQDGQLLDTQSMVGTAGALATVAHNEYNSAGQLVWETDGVGHKVQYTYDALSRVLTRSVDPAGLNLTSKTVYRANSRELWSQDANGVWTRSVFDKLGQLTSVTIDPTTTLVTGGQVFEVAHPGLDITTSTTYDADGHTLSVTDPNQVITQYVYDNLGRRVKEIADFGSGINAATGVAYLNLVTQYGYDLNNNVVSKTRPIDATTNATTHYAYDSENRLIYAVDALNNVVKSDYDKEGRVTKTTAYATPIVPSTLGWSVANIAAQLALNAANPADGVSIALYNKDGRQSISINGEGYASELFYNAAGQVIKTVRYATQLLAAQLSNLGNLVSSDATALASQWKLPTSAVGSTLGDDRISYFKYDAAGRQVATVDGEGYVSESIYDQAGQVTKTVRYAKATALALRASVLPADWRPGLDVANNNDVTISNVYDNAGRLTDTTDGEGFVTHRVYDKAGRETDFTRAFGRADASTTHRTLDAAGRVTAETQGYLNPLATATLSYVLDANGNRIQIVDPRGAGYTTTQTFDALGRKTVVTDALGASIKTEYDALGHAAKVTDQRGNAGYFYYDKSGRLTLHVSPEGYVTQTTYDAFDNAVSVKQFATKLASTPAVGVAPSLPAANAALDTLTTSTYDHLGQLLSTTVSLSPTTSSTERNTWNAFGNKASFTNALASGGGVFKYLYDRNGNLTQETLPIQSKNAAGLMVDVINTYTYDARGNKTGMNEGLLAEQRVTTYQYDRLDRLIKTLGQAVSTTEIKLGATPSGYPAYGVNVVPTQSQTYDARGNVIQATDANGHSTFTYYDALDRKVAEVSPTGMLTTRFFDAAGNVTAVRVYGNNVALPTVPGGLPPAPVNAANYRETLFSYDADNRQIETRIKNVQLGRYNGLTNTYEFSTADVVTQMIYDATGNVVQQIDGNGNSSYAYYDKLGRKVAEVDAARYLTTRSYQDATGTQQAKGLVMSQVRYAQQIPADNASFSLSSQATVAALVALASTDPLLTAANRTTQYSYDLKGRLLAQTELNVESSGVGATGAVTSSVGSVSTLYQYDGLDNIVQKTDANGGVSNWNFDNIGRMTRHQGLSFIDFEGVAVRPTERTTYDGLNNVVESTQEGKTDTTATTVDDRITRYVYGVGGRLSTKTDAAGVVTSYEYDAQGNQTQSRFNIIDADGTQTVRIQQTRYDAANNVVATYDLDAGLNEVRYNAYGEVTGKRLNAGAGVAAGGVNLGLWQEFAEYNALGKVFKTNSGNGNTKAYFYDANGNATLVVESATVDLQADPNTKTQTQLIAAMGVAGNSYNQTISVYDARNQLSDTLQPNTADSRGTTGVGSFVTTAPSSPITVTPPSSSGAGNAYAVSAVGSVAVNGVEAVGLKRLGWVMLSDPSPGGGGNRVNRTYDGYFASDFWLSVTPPPSLRYSGDLVVELTVSTERYAATMTPGSITTHTYTSELFPATAPEITLKATNFPGNWWPSFKPTAHFFLALYQEVPGVGRVLLSSVSDATSPSGPAGEKGLYALAPYGPATSMSATGAYVQIKGQSASTDRVILMYRPTVFVGVNNYPYSMVEVPKLLNTAGAAIPGMFQLDSSMELLPWEKYEYVYVGLHADGTVLNRGSGTLTTNPVTPVVIQDPPPLSLGGNGKAYFTYTTLDLTELGVDAASYALRARRTGTTLPWLEGPQFLGSNYPLLGVVTPGWLPLSLKSLGPGNWDLQVDVMNASGTLLRTLTTTVSNLGTGAATATPLSSFKPQPSLVALSLAATARNLSLQIRLAGTTGAYTTVSIASTDGQFKWDASALVVDRLVNYDYEYLYSATDAAGLVVNKAHGTLRLGANAATLSYVDDNAVPAAVQFAPSAAAARMHLSYRLSGTFGAYAAVDLVADATGKFNWDATALGAFDYEYMYELRNAANGALPGATAGSGVLHLRPPTATVNSVISVGPDSTGSLVHRSQVRNAFGEIVREIDALGHVTNLAYTHLGQLARKELPKTLVTAETGLAKLVAPVTTYQYDKTGQMVASVDANVNTISTQLLAWEQAPGAAARVAKEFHPDPGVVTTGYDIFGDMRYSIDAINRRTDYTYDSRGLLTSVQRPARPPDLLSIIGGSIPSTGTPRPGPVSPPVRATDSYGYDAAGNRISHTNELGTEKTFYDRQDRVIGTRSFLGFNITYAYTYAGGILGAGGFATSGWRKATTNMDGRTLIDDVSYFGNLAWHQDMAGRQFTYSYDWANRLVKQTGTTAAIPATATVAAIPSGPGQNIDYAYYTNGYIKSVTDNALDTLARFGYDAQGNRTYEDYSTRPVQAGGKYQTFYEMSTVQYDELNRVVQVVDPKATIRYEYDAVGNRRRVYSEYHDALGAISTQDYWYAYDSMNRFVVSKGQLVGGTIDAGGKVTMAGAVARGVQDGVLVGYDPAGQRSWIVTQDATPQFDSKGKFTNYTYAAAHKERYTYTSEGYLESVYIATSNATTPLTNSPEVLRSYRTNDLRGRVTGYQEYNVAGTALTVNRTTTYDLDSRTLSEVDKATGGGTTTYFYNDRTATGPDLIGLQSTKTVTGTVTINSFYRYEYWDDAKESKITAKPWDPNLLGGTVWSPGKTDMTYDVNGHLQAAIDHNAPGGARTMQYVNDAYGQILQRWEKAGGLYQKNTVYYYLNEERIGEIGNDGPSRVSYAEAMALAKKQKKAKPNAYRYGHAASSADFDQNYSPVSPGNSAATSSSYVVRSGDTLQSVALTVWGDASMWYLIADANGLSSADTLTAGQLLSLPNQLTNIHNNASTFRPYSPGEAIGNLQPTLPEPVLPPPKFDNCAFVMKGVIMIAVMAVAIVLQQYEILPAITAGLGTAFGAATPMIAAGLSAAVAAGAVSALNQGLQVATGLSDQFNWGEVGISAAAAGLTAGLAEGLVPLSDELASIGIPAKLAKYAVQMSGGAVANVATQGLSMSSGLQKKFSWLDVGIAAGKAAVDMTVKDIGWLKDDTSARDMGLGSLTNTGRAAGRGLLGNLGGQGLAMLAGKQSKFDWQGAVVATGSAAADHVFKHEVTWLQEPVKSPIPANNLVYGWNADTLSAGASSVARAGLMDVVTQGLKMAVGKQSAFNWKATAGAAIGAAVDFGVDRLESLKATQELKDPKGGRLLRFDDPGIYNFSEVNPFDLQETKDAFSGGNLIRKFISTGLRESIKQGLKIGVGLQRNFDTAGLLKKLAESERDYIVGGFNAKVAEAVKNLQDKESPPDSAPWKFSFNSREILTGVSRRYDPTTHTNLNELLDLAKPLTRQFPYEAFSVTPGLDFDVPTKAIGRRTATDTAPSAWEGVAALQATNNARVTDWLAARSAATMSGGQTGYGGRRGGIAESGQLRVDYIGGPGTGDEYSKGQADINIIREAPLFIAGAYPMYSEYTGPADLPIESVHPVEDIIFGGFGIQVGSARAAIPVAAGILSAGYNAIVQYTAKGSIDAGPMAWSAVTGAVLARFGSSFAAPLAADPLKIGLASFRGAAWTGSVGLSQTVFGAGANTATSLSAGLGGALITYAGPIVGGAVNRAGGSGLGAVYAGVEAGLPYVVPPALATGLTAGFQMPAWSDGLFGKITQTQQRVSGLFSSFAEQAPSLADDVFNYQGVQQVAGPLAGIYKAGRLASTGGYVGATISARDLGMYAGILATLAPPMVSRPLIGATMYLESASTVGGAVQVSVSGSSNGDMGFWAGVSVGRPNTTVWSGVSAAEPIYGGGVANGPVLRYVADTALSAVNNAGYVITVGRPSNSGYDIGATMSAYREANISAFGPKSIGQGFSGINNIPWIGFKYNYPH